MRITPLVIAKTRILDGVRLSGIDGTWRAQTTGEAISLGAVLSYLEPHRYPLDTGTETETRTRPRVRELVRRARQVDQAQLSLLPIAGEDS